MILSRFVALISASFLWASLAAAQEEETVFPEIDENAPRVESDVGGEIERVDNPGAGTETAPEDDAVPVPEESANPESETQSTAASEQPESNPPAESQEEKAKAPEQATSPEEKPADPAPAKEESKTESATATATEKKDDRYGSDFGSFRLAVGGGQPKFSDKLKYYDLFYGKEKIHPDFFLDYYFLDWYLTMGVGVHMRYYRATGHALNASNNSGTFSEADVDKNSEAELVLIPVQGVINIEITPWKTSFLTLNGWMGLERMYYQETRYAGKVAGGSDDDAKPYVNKGYNSGKVVGASVSLRLDFLDRTAVRSLEVLGFRSILLTPYVERVVANKDEGVPYNERTTIGAVFTFESIY